MTKLARQFKDAVCFSENKVKFSDLFWKSGSLSSCIINKSILSYPETGAHACAE